MATLTRRPRQRGIALVEMALVLPLLFLLLFGLLEYGWLFFKYQQIAGAARDGCRVGVAQGKASADVTSTVNARMASAGLTGTYTTGINPAEVLTALPGSTVTVTVTVPYANIELTGFPLPLPTNLVGETSMVKEGAPLTPP